MTLSERDRARLAAFTRGNPAVRVPFTGDEVGVLVLVAASNAYRWRGNDAVVPARVQHAMDRVLDRLMHSSQGGSVDLTAVQVERLLGLLDSEVDELRTPANAHAWNTANATLRKAAGLAEDTPGAEQGTASAETDDEPTRTRTGTP